MLSQFTGGFRAMALDLHPSKAVASNHPTKIRTKISTSAREPTRCGHGLRQWAGVRRRVSARACARGDGSFTHTLIHTPSLIRSPTRAHGAPRSPSQPAQSRTAPPRRAAAGSDGDAARRRASPPRPPPPKGPSACAVRASGASGAVRAAASTPRASAALALSVITAPRRAARWRWRR